MSQRTPQGTLARGVVLDGRYRIERVIGSGRYASVYKAVDMIYNVVRAVKEVTDPDKGVREQFRLEADLLINHTHPNIPRGYKVLEVGKRIYFVMEFVGGKDVEELLNESLTQQRRPLDEAHVLRWAIEICSALSSIHELRTPIIHRDVKPANIKITPEDRPILIDFGLATLQWKTPQAIQATAQGVSPGFAPPEQYMAKDRTDARTDIYGLGATLYTCLTGRDPAEAPARLVDQTGVSHGLRPTPRALNPRISACTEEVIIKALELSPSKRHQSAAELEADLRDALNRLTAATAAGATLVMPQGASGAAPKVDPASAKRPVVAPAGPKAPMPVATVGGQSKAGTAPRIRAEQPASPAAAATVDPRTAKQPIAAPTTIDSRTGKQPIVAPAAAAAAGAGALGAATALKHGAAPAAATDTAQHRTLAAAQPSPLGRSSGKHPAAVPPQSRIGGGNNARPIVATTASEHPVLHYKPSISADTVIPPAQENQSGEQVSPTSMTTPRTFISYSREDVEKVNQLKSKLATAGVDVWLDHEKLTAGTPNWQVKVREGIRNARVVIYAGSPSAAVSSFVIHEMQIARGEAKYVIPIWIRGKQWYDCAPFGESVAQYIDAREEKFDRGVADLLTALSAQIKSEGDQSD